MADIKEMSNEQLVEDLIDAIILGDPLITPMGKLKNEILIRMNGAHKCEVRSKDKKVKPDQSCHRFINR